MNEQELFEYRINKFKDKAIIVYITVLAVAVLAIAFVKLS
jgi:hypothetical protein